VQPRLWVDLSPVRARARPICEGLTDYATDSGKAAYVDAPTVRGAGARPETGFGEPSCPAPTPLESGHWNAGSATGVIETV
jgi:hypothetical protein